MDAKLRVAGILSLAAGVVHGGLGPEHFREWWGYGLLFAVAATAQIILGLALLMDPIDPKHPRAGTLRRAMLVGGIAGNLALVALYVVTRTVGIPTGPAAGQIEDVAPLDVATQAIEIAIALLLAVELRTRRARHADAGS